MSSHHNVRGNHFKIWQNLIFGNDTNKSKLLLQKFRRRLRSRNSVYVYKIVNIKILVTIILPVVFMHVKIGTSRSRKNADWGCLRTGSLGRIFGSVTDVAGRCRKLLNEEFIICTTMKSRRMR